MTATVDNAVADLQRANAELQRQLGEYRAERDEAFAQQTATAEVLGIINASPGDLAPVFDAILEKALHLCEASNGGLQTFDGEFFRMVANRGDPRYQRLAMQMGPFRPERGSTVDRLVQGESVVQVLDLSADEQYKGGGPIRRNLMEIGGARTFLSLSRCEKTKCWSVRSMSIGRKCGRSRIGRSRCCKTSRHRPSSRWRTRG